MAHTSQGTEAARQDTGSAGVPAPRNASDPVVVLDGGALLVRESDVSAQHWEDTQNCVLLTALTTRAQHATTESASSWGKEIDHALSGVCLWKRRSEDFSFSQLSGELPVILAADVLRHVLRSGSVDNHVMLQWVDALFDPSGAADGKAFTSGTVLVGHVTRGQSGPAMELRAYFAKPAPEQNMLVTPVAPHGHAVHVATVDFEHATAQYAAHQEGGSLRERVKKKLGERAINLTG